MPVKITPEALVKKDYRNTNLAYKKKCIECGCVYYAKHDRSLYCSRQCNNVFSRRKRNSAKSSKIAQGGITELPSTDTRIIRKKATALTKALEIPGELSKQELTADQHDKASKQLFEMRDRKIVPPNWEEGLIKIEQPIGRLVGGNEFF